MDCRSGSGREACAGDGETRRLLQGAGVGERHHYGGRVYLSSDAIGGIDRLQIQTDQLLGVEVDAEREPAPQRRNLTEMELQQQIIELTAPVLISDAQLPDRPTVREVAA